MDEPGKLGSALQHIGEHGDLRGLADSRTAKLALIKTAQQHGLAVWDKSRGRYQLTAEGYRRAAAWSPQIDATLRKRRSRRRTIAFAGIAAILAGCIAVGSAHVMSDDAGRKTNAGRQNDFAAIGPIAARAKNGLWAMAGEHRQASAPPPAAATNSTAAANIKAAPAAGESDRRIADRVPTAAEQKARKIARAQRQQRLAASRERRQNPGYTGYTGYTGSALAFGDDGRGARRGYPGYPSTSGPPVTNGRPNGWGW
jgi:hypothetical protein